MNLKLSITVGIAFAFGFSQQELREIDSLKRQLGCQKINDRTISIFSSNCLLPKVTSAAGGYISTVSQRNLNISKGGSIKHPALHLGISSHQHGMFFYPNFNLH